MTIRLSTELVEGSTGQISIDFTDANDDPVVPVSAVWSLRDPSGNIINSRERVAFVPLDTTVYAVLSGDDLAIYGDQDECVRFFTVEAVYSSDEGSNLPLNDSASFKIRRLVGIS